MTAAHIFASCHMSADTNHKTSVADNRRQYGDSQSYGPITNRHALFDVFQFLLRYESHRAPRINAIASVDPMAK